MHSAGISRWPNGFDENRSRRLHIRRNRERTEQVAPFFRKLVCELAGEPKEISDYGIIRGGRDLLRMAADFGLVEGKASKHFAPAHVPETAFMWALYDLYDKTPNAYKSDWRFTLALVPSFTNCGRAGDFGPAPVSETRLPDCRLAFAA